MQVKTEKHSSSKWLLSDFLDDLESAGITLRAEQEKLIVDAPKGAMTSELAGVIRERKSELLAFLRQAKRSAAELPEIVSVLGADENGRFPLSHAQERLWFLDKFAPNQATYNIPEVVRLRGELNFEALKNALDQLVERQTSLRTNFGDRDGVPYQRVQSYSMFALEQVDLSHLSEAAGVAESRQRVYQLAHRPFNLNQESLFRAQLIKLADDDHILTFVMHHIISDGWSFSVFWEELSAYYAAFDDVKGHGLPKLPIQYVDYANWQRRELEDDLFDEQLAYWRHQLAGELPVLELPLDYARPDVQTYSGDVVRVSLSADILSQLRQFSLNHNVTLFMTLLTGFNVLLQKYTQQNDIIVGSPVAGRATEQLEKLIGFFINTVALRNDLSGDPTVQELLGRVRDVALGAYANQMLPLEKLVADLQPERDTSRSPIFQTFFALQNVPEETMTLGQLDIEPFEFQFDAAHFDLGVYAEEQADDTLQISARFNTDLFESVTIERLLIHFETILQQMLEMPTATLGELSLLSADEQSQLQSWNDTVAPMPEHEAIHIAFEKQAELTPNAVAVEFNGERRRYEQINHCANQLAHYLREQGVQPDTLVGVFMDRSFEMIISVLAILKAGGAYLPLDPIYPAERRAYMLDNADARMVLTSEAMRDQVAGLSQPTFFVDTDWAKLSDYSNENPEPISGLENLLYVIYTSGSTGKPKGVMLPHRAMVNLINWQEKQTTLGLGSRTVQFTSLSFDVSCQEIFATLGTGGTLVLVKSDVRRDMDQFVRFLHAQQIERIYLPFIALQQLAEAALRFDQPLSYLREVITAGEQLQVTEALMRFFSEIPNCTLVNQYGPTESHVVTAYTLKGTPDMWPSLPPIGKPIDNTQIHLLDKSMNPVPVGVVGELYIGGMNVAHGYISNQLTVDSEQKGQRPEAKGQRLIGNLNFAEETISSFIQSEQLTVGSGQSEPSESPISIPQSLYKTGDLARYLPNGDIEYLGRAGSQVKIRGYRIELGEIEAVVAGLDGVQESAVNLHEADGDKYLIAYLVGENIADRDALRQQLKTQLPEYMVPEQFVVLDALPLTPSGKVDRKNLPIPENSVRENTSDYVAPQDAFETELVALWEKLLRVKPIGIHDDFFDLGGHSLMAVRMFSTLEEKLGKKIPLTTLFQAPTIATLSAVLQAGEWEQESSALVMIQKGRAENRPFFHVSAYMESVLAFTELGRQLPDDQPFYGIQAVGLEDDTAPHETIEEMAAHYLREIKAIQPEGPYLLGGHCAGGWIAFEMAKQLEQVGEQVDALVLVDSPAPNFVPPSDKAVTYYGGRFMYYLRDGRLLNALAWKYQVKIQSKLLYNFGSKKAKRIQLVRRAHDRAFDQYEEAADFVGYSGPMTIFRSNEYVYLQDERIHTGWEALTEGGAINYDDLPGTHATLLKQPAVSDLGVKLSQAIQTEA